MQEGLRILENIKKEFGVPIVTDIHHPEDAATVAEVADVLQGSVIGQVKAHYDYLCLLVDYFS